MWNSCAGVHTCFPAISLPSLKEKDSEQKSRSPNTLTQPQVSHSHFSHSQLVTQINLHRGTGADISDCSPKIPTQDWFQGLHPAQIPKFTDIQVPCIKMTGYLHTPYIPSSVCFKSPQDYFITSASMSMIYRELFCTVLLQENDKEKNLFMFTADIFFLKLFPSTVGWIQEWNIERQLNHSVTSNRCLSRCCLTAHRWCRQCCNWGPCLSPALYRVTSQVESVFSHQVWWEGARGNQQWEHSYLTFQVVPWTLQNPNWIQNSVWCLCLKSL